MKRTETKRKEALFRNETAGLKHPNAWVGWSPEVEFIV